MCLIAFALGVVPGHPLLIASNRDEHLDRPTLPLHAWQLANGTPVVAGRDQHAGGTWLGVTPQGRVAMLTNVRQTHAGPGPRSRGELVTRWLQGHGALLAEDRALLEELAPAKPEGVARYADLITYVQDRPGHDLRYAIDAGKIAQGVRLLATLKDGTLDPSVGVTEIRKVGTQVKQGEPLIMIHYNDEAKVDAALPYFRDAYRLAPKRPNMPPLVVERVA